MQITKTDAQDIARKLEAKIQTGGAHNIAAIWVDDVLVAKFGIRHGSRRDQSHQHIPKDIHFSPNKTKQLAQCTISRDQWIQSMKEQGFID